jgi:CRISPR/Cas system CMR subunit Cmr6 (Cas7 group RAMP superfamily)
MTMKKTVQTTLLLMVSVIVLFSCTSNPKQNDTKDNEIIANHELVKTDNLEIIENNESDAQWDNISRQSITIDGYPLSKCMKLLVGESNAKVIVEGLSHDPVMYITYRPDDVWNGSVEENRQAVIDALKVTH